MDNKYRNTFISPLGLTFDQWASRFYYSNPGSTVSLPPHVSEWHRWASYILADKEYANAPIPHKSIYPATEDWERWAIAFLNYMISR